MRYRRFTVCVRIMGPSEWAGVPKPLEVVYESQHRGRHAAGRRLATIISRRTAEAKAIDRAAHAAYARWNDRYREQGAVVVLSISYTIHDAVTGSYSSLRQHRDSHGA